MTNEIHMRHGVHTYQLVIGDALPSSTVSSLLTKTRRVAARTPR